jgi:hypothetical protein
MHKYSIHGQADRLHECRLCLSGIISCGRVAAGGGTISGHALGLTLEDGGMGGGNCVGQWMVVHVCYQTCHGWTVLRMTYYQSI